MIGRHIHYSFQNIFIYLFLKKSCLVDYLWLYFWVFQGFYQKIIRFSTTSKLKLLLTLKPNISYMQVANTIFHPNGPRQRAKGARAPPGSKIFFFLVYKIFIKKAWAPWFLAWAPLTSPIPVPVSQPRSFQEPMKTLKNIYIYICVKKKKEKRKKRRKPSSQ